MATWLDVAQIALSLPATEEKSGRDGSLTWTVKGKHFVWQRRLGKGDLKYLGNNAPKGATGAFCVGVEEEKFELIAANPKAFFTTPHFDGYPAVLFTLSAIRKPELREVITDAWIARAPEKLVHQFLQG